METVELLTGDTQSDIGMGTLLTYPTRPRPRLEAARLTRRQSAAIVAAKMSHCSRDVADEEEAR